MAYHPAERADGKRSRPLGTKKHVEPLLLHPSAERGGCSVTSQGSFTGGQIMSMSREFCCINPGDGYSCTQSPSVPSSPKESISKLQLTLCCWWQRMASGWGLTSHVVCYVRGPATSSGFQGARPGPWLFLNQLDAPPYRCHEFASSFSSEMKNPPNIQGENW